MFLLVLTAALVLGAAGGALVLAAFGSHDPPSRHSAGGSALSTCKILHLDATDQPEFIIFLK